MKIKMKNFLQLFSPFFTFSDHLEFVNRSTTQNRTHTESSICLQESLLRYEVIFTPELVDFVHRRIISLLLALRNALIIILYDYASIQHHSITKNNVVGGGRNRSLTNSVHCKHYPTLTVIQHQFHQGW